MPTRIPPWLLGVLVPLSLQAQASPDLLEFYPLAAGRAAHPPDQSRLRIACQVRLEGPEIPQGFRGLWLSLLGAGSDRVLLAAFTRAKFDKPGDVISLTVRYRPLPTGLAGPAGTLDWGYVHDRNGDGRVDYLVYLQNAHPVLPDPVPDSFPVVERLPGGQFRAARPLLHAIIDLGQLVFRHYADDDFDGRVDGVVVEAFDHDRPMFVRDWVVYRAVPPDGEFDQAWAFRNSIRDTVRAVPRGEAGYTVPAMEGQPGAPLQALVERGSRRLALINDVVGRCQVPVSRE